MLLIYQNERLNEHVSVGIICLQQRGSFKVHPYFLAFKVVYT